MERSDHRAIEIIARAERDGLLMRGRLESGMIAAVCLEPKDACAIVEKFIRYRSDRRDEWQTPEETLRRRAGDCEDFAILIQDVCERMGYPTDVYLFFEEMNRLGGHAVAAGRLLDGRWWYADNGSYHEVGTFEELRARIAGRMGWSVGGTWHAKLDRRHVRSRLAHAGGSHEFTVGSVNAR